MSIGQKSTTIISQAELGSKKHFNIDVKRRGKIHQ